MDLTSFITSFTTSFVIFIVLVLLFTWLSRKPGNSVVYYPNPISRGLDPFENRKRSMNPVGWIREAFVASEADVIAASGVDAAVYLVFLSTVLGILVFSGVLLLPALLPVAGTDDALKLANQNSKTAGNYSELEKLAMGNVQEKSTRLWAFMLGVYWVSIVTYYILWRSYKHVSNLRATAKSSPEPKPEDFAILVRDVPSRPSDQSLKDRVDSYFRRLHPDTFYRSMVVTNLKKVNKIYNNIEGYKKKLAHAEAVFAESKTTGNPEGARPTMRTGLLGLVGSKVDTINHCNEKIKELILKLEAEQKITLQDKQERAALVFFNNRAAAASAAQTILAQMVDTWMVSEAPEPRAVIWPNLSMRLYMRQIRQAIVYTLVFLTVVFYMIPIAFISAFTTLDNLEKLAPFLKKVVEQPEIKTVLEAYLPQIVLIVFLALLPAFLMFLSKSEGIPSESHAVRAAAGKYFYFIVFNVFLGVTISGTLWSSLKRIINHPGDLITLLATSLPGNATFFLTFVALKFFVGYGLELSRLVPLIIFHLKKKFLCKTEEEIKEAWAPGDLGFATRVPSDMLIVTIVLCYSVIAPLIIPFGAIYFGLGWLVAKNQVLRVYVPSYESNGRMWPHMHTRILAALIIYQITMVGFMIIKKFVYAPFLFLLIPISFVYAAITKNRFYKSFAATPLEVAARELKEVPNMEAIYAAYIPPCLKTEKLEDVELFEDAQSHATSRTTSF
ncbi:ERD (early-responsive to dehydration stress) family protein [Rhynchospora pubera]|uniref:ERD (Early-responsive to dehydration stress) family protein n=1 Tax=Rhynchospora pubera TaxID=906938 RepID=A0AAV8CVE9_9POAL|nr:ERD (early-responsive to dehydration stress) family protein [Rhynchospora pubera]